jgi:lipoate---protein ligase
VANNLVARSGEGNGGPSSPIDDACAPAGASGAGDAGRWQVHRLRDGAAALHSRPWPSPPSPSVWVLDVDRPALVLGSTQPDGLVDHEAAARAGVDVVRRRSGGGAVLVEPGGTVWVDVVVPPGDPLWDDDVGRAAHWVGEAWVAALARTGTAGATVHTGGLVTTPWSRQVCFAGLGPGEVVVGGRKVVGVAQRRTRHGARFQVAALLRWEPEALLRLLRLEDPDAALADVAGRAAGVLAPEDALVSALLDVLLH